jgi:hypothetical protein
MMKWLSKHKGFVNICRRSVWGCHNTIINIYEIYISFTIFGKFFHTAIHIDIDKINNLQRYITEEVGNMRESAKRYFLQEIEKEIGVNDSKRD